MLLDKLGQFAVHPALDEPVHPYCHTTSNAHISKARTRSMPPALLRTIPPTQKQHPTCKSGFITRCGHLKKISRIMHFRIVLTCWSLIVVILLRCYRPLKTLPTYLLSFKYLHCGDPYNDRFWIIPIITSPLQRIEAYLQAWKCSL